MQFELFVLGSNGAVPAYNRHPSSQVLTYNGQHYMIDCGEGTQLQMNRYGIKRGKLDHVFISHLHGDHYFGLIGLLTSLNLNQREAPMHIFGPKGLQEIIEVQFKHAQTNLRFPIIFSELDTTVAQVIYEDHFLSVSTIPLKHRIPTAGFLFTEKPGYRKIIKEKIEEYGLRVDQILALKEGRPITLDDGRLIANEEFTFPPHPPRTFAYCSDTAYSEAIVEQIQGVDLLYHESTFIEDHRLRAEETYHSTAIQAASIAAQANAGKLLLGHFSARYDNLQPLLQEARSVFAAAELAEEGKLFQVRM